jgi:hypothetical protein
VRFMLGVGGYLCKSGQIALSLGLCTRWRAAMSFTLG